MGGQEKAKTSILSRHLLNLDAPLDIRRNANFSTNYKIENTIFTCRKILIRENVTILSFLTYVKFRSWHIWHKTKF